MSNFYVRVIKDETGEVVKEMGPMSERRAEKVERGLNYNLNHELYYSVVLERDE